MIPVVTRKYARPLSIIQSVAVVTVFAMFLAGNACAKGPRAVSAPSASTADASKAELIAIMKGVHFTPVLGKDNPFCKAFYKDFKHQTNIEHIKPIVTAQSYDAPALKPYRNRCPKLDFRKSLSVPGNQNTTGWTEEDWEAAGTPTFGLHDFNVYRVDLDNNPQNGKELVFYYEGEKTIRTALPIGKPQYKQEIFNQSGRAYQGIDLNSCRFVRLGIGFNRGGSAQWTRNGIINYRHKNAIYVLESGAGRKPNYRHLDLDLYSKELKRTVPVCVYAIQHKND